MRSSKKRKIAGLPMKNVTVKIKDDVYAKLATLAGKNSLAETVEEMTLRYYRLALRRNRNM